MVGVTFTVAVVSWVVAVACVHSWLDALKELKRLRRLKDDVAELAVHSEAQALVLSGMAESVSLSRAAELRALLRDV